MFTLASLLAGLAWSEASLIAARALQGLGAAIISPAALSILSTTFAEGRERNIALGVWGAVGGFGAAAGVLLGGILTDALSWEWIFFVNVPVGVAAFVLAPLSSHESRDAHVKSFDAPGAVLVTAGLVSLVYAITQAARRLARAGRSASSRRRSPCSSASSLWELRHPEPLMRFGILRTRTVAGRERRRVHPRHGDVLDVPDADAVHAAGARLLADEDRRRVPRGRRHGDPLVGRRGAARDPRRREAGARRRDGRADRGLVYFTQVSVDGSYLGDLLPGFLLVGVGIGFSFVPISIAALAGVQPAEAGLASGLINTSQQIGGALGIAALSTIATSRTADASSRPAPRCRSALVDGFTGAFIAGVGIAAVGIVAALTLIRRDELEHAPAELEPALDLAA